MEPPVSAIARAGWGWTCRPTSGVSPCAFEPRSAVGERRSGRVAAFAACFTVSAVAWATSTTTPRRLQARMTSAPNGVSPSGVTAPVWEVADVVRGVVDELHGADAAPVRLLEALELALEEVEALDVHDDRGVARRVR